MIENYNALNNSVENPNEILYGIFDVSPENLPAACEEYYMDLAVLNLGGVNRVYICLKYNGTYIWKLLNIYDIPFIHQEIYEKVLQILAKEKDQDEKLTAVLRGNQLISAAITDTDTLITNKSDYIISELAEDVAGVNTQVINSAGGISTYLTNMRSDILGDIDSIQEIKIDKMILSPMEVLPGVTFTLNVSWETNLDPTEIDLYYSTADPVSVSPSATSYSAIKTSRGTPGVIPVKLEVKRKTGTTTYSEDRVKFDEKVLNINCYLPTFYFVSSADTLTDSTFSTIISDNYSQYLTDNKGAFTVTAGTNDYIYCASPVSYGDTILAVNGFVGGFEQKYQLTGTFTVDNKEFTVNYYIYRSSNKNLGTTTVNLL